ncbi:SRPBCC family protein [Calothrix sp. 336/3]|uniref:SRPBCC family protein n=1 Tax=Calothrix sp. 336/3 TaxID=1337936 RepID=UPI0004E3B1BC|nr:SRPBCC family protein [Calothrix sp. 336/3]AKG22673.1 cyclase [Calothrix sp. 336/3]
MSEQQYISEIADITLESDGEINSSDLQAVEVEVEKTGDRRRRITAYIEIPHPLDYVWKVITDYEALAEFIPNLAKSQLLPHPEGGIRLEQVGSQRLMKLNFSARVVLDLEENFPQAINFQMVEGDLKEFYGCWKLEGCLVGTKLCYSITVHPKLTMPVGMIEKRLAKDLQVNLLAIRQRVQQLATSPA